MIDPAAPRPLQPALERGHGLVVGKSEDQPQLLFEQVRAVEAPVHVLSDGAQLDLLLLGQVLGVLDQRPAAVLDVSLA